MRQRISSIMRGIRSFLRVTASSKASLIGFIVIIGYAFMAVVGPFIVRLDLVGRSPEYLLPSLEHPLGTDYIGRDIFAQIVHGSRDVLLLAVIASMLTITVSVLVGTVAGMSGGKVDIVLTFVSDVMLTIPSFPLLIVIATAIRGASNPLILGSALALTSWASRARAIRSQVLSLKKSDFVEASRCAGFNRLYIIFSDIVPSIMPYIAVSTLLLILQAIYSIVGLSLVGAIPWSECNWGIMINTAVDQAGAPLLSKAVPYLLAPLLVIAILQISLIMFSRSIEITFNPRLRER